MSEDLRDFLSATLSRPGDAWSEEGLQRMARLPIPDRAFRWGRDILKGDIHRQWAEWFLGTFCDVDEYAASNRTYPDIYAQIKAHIAATWTEMDDGDQLALSKEVARLAFAEATRRADIAARVTPQLTTRQYLIDLSRGTPHCWICGWRFSEAAVATFLGEPQSIALPQLVDIFKPIGLKPRHLRIEVDHVTAHSAGGPDELENLRLGCGWCNSHKSNRTSIYEVSGDPRPSRIGSSRTALPQPFWVVRLLTMERRRAGLSPADGELTVALRNPKGGVNPANLRIVSYGDDPMGSSRFVGRADAARIWSANIE